MSSQLAKSAKSIKNHHRPINQKKRPLMILPARFFPYICRNCFDYIDTDRWFGHPSPMGGEGNQKSNLWKMEPTDIDYVVVVGGIAEMWWQIMKTQKHGSYLSQSQSLLSDVWFVSHCLANLCRFFIMDMVAFLQGGKGHTVSVNINWYQLISIQLLKKHTLTLKLLFFLSISCSKSPV